MVASIDGAATVDDRSGGLSGATDQLLLHLLRALADVVIIGAETARQEGYAGLQLPTELEDRAQLTPTPLVVVTRSLQLPDALLVEAGRSGSIFAAPADIAATQVERAQHLGAEVLRIPGGDGGVNLGRLLEVLHARGLHRVLTEGGPALLGQLLDAHLVDEVCLTISPRIVGGAGPRITHGPSRQHAMRLDAVLADEDDFLFTRYQRHC